MQCKHCGDSDLEHNYEEIFDETTRYTFVEPQFLCKTCGAVHFLKFNWRDFDCVPLPKGEEAWNRIR